MIDPAYLSYKSEIDKQEGGKKKWLDVLLKNEDQYHDYIFNYLNDLDRMSPIMDYRESRLRSQKTTFEEFEKHFLINKQQSLEDLFLEPIDKRKIEFLEEQIEEGSISLHKLYEDHVAEPTYRIMRLLL